MSLTDQVNQLPHTPGVYLMKDRNSRILYVGKSKDLKNRVTSYFHSNSDRHPKIERLVHHIKDIEIQHTDTEFEALLLECHLIFTIKPLYNKRLKNHDHYGYLCFLFDEKKPTINMTIKDQPIGDHFCIGPFTNRRLLKQSIIALQRYVGILCLSDSNFSTTCLNNTLGFCSNICQSNLSKDTYQSINTKLQSILKGENISILKDIENQMKNAADKLDFEIAQLYKEDMQTLESLLNRCHMLDHMNQHPLYLVSEKLNDQKAKYFLIQGTSILMSNRYTMSKESAQSTAENIMKKIPYLVKDPLEKKSCVTTDTIDKAQIIYNYIHDEASHSLPLDPVLGDKSSQLLKKVMQEALFFS